MKSAVLHPTSFRSQTGKVYIDTTFCLVNLKPVAENHHVVTASQPFNSCPLATSNQGGGALAVYCLILLPYLEKRLRGQPQSSLRRIF